MLSSKTFYKMVTSTYNFTVVFFVRNVISLESFTHKAVILVTQDTSVFLGTGTDVKIIGIISPSFLNLKSST